MMQQDPHDGTARLPRLGVFATIVSSNVRMPGNVTFQQWQANPALQQSQPNFANGEFILYLKDTDQESCQSKHVPFT